MTVSALSLTPVSGTFAVCRLAPDESLPAWAEAGDFLSITRTPEELSVVCRESLVPESVTSEIGWACLRVEGPLPFSSTGILASLATSLADAGVSLFAISTFDTDYLMVRTSDLSRAVDALTRAGHRLKGAGNVNGWRASSKGGADRPRHPLQRKSHGVPVDLRRCADEDFDAIHRIINEAAQAYRGVIPADCWHEPYMSREELRAEIDDGVCFWGAAREGALVGVMGIQERGPVDLIRHAYVLPGEQGQRVGSQLLRTLESMTGRTLLVGTWTAATWAVSFYQKHGYRLVGDSEKVRLLQTYWRIPERQVATSVVLTRPGVISDRSSPPGRLHASPSRSRPAPPTQDDPGNPRDQ